MKRNMDEKNTDWKLSILIFGGVISLGLTLLNAYTVGNITKFIHEISSIWLFSVYVGFVAFYIAYRRYRIADEQLKIATNPTRKEDRDRYLTKRNLLANESMASQLAGVRGLTELLEAHLVKEARIPLEDFLRVNWGLDASEKVSNARHDRVRNEIINNLYRIDRNIDLSSLYLRGAELGDKDLSNVNLFDTDLAQTDLSRSHLRGKNLSRANLSGANLRDANLRGADLSKANLSGADLSEADLSGADLSEADLSGADLSEADLSGANLENVNLTGTDLSKAKGVPE